MEIINTIVHIFHSLLKEIVKVSQLPEYFTTINESIRRGIVDIICQIVEVLLRTIPAGFF